MTNVLIGNHPGNCPIKELRKLMSWSSYAQNQEDVMLMRALKHIDRGFYIDVGAQGPEDGSVTRAFYERGWSGINIEPSSEFFGQLKQERRRDVNLRLFAGANKASRKFFEVAGTGLSTGVPEIAENYKDMNKKVTYVEQSTLDDVCERHVKGDVHFLKIDTEGAEAEVIAGFSLTKVRPWILIVEATLPNTAVERYEEWEPRLLERNYEFVWSDGINRFYVAQEHSPLKKAFRTPPNYFDDFVPFRVARAREEEDRLHNHIRALQAHNDGLVRQIEQLGASVAMQAVRLQTLEAELAGIRASTSWRMTRPLRSAVDFARRRGVNVFRQSTQHAPGSQPEEIPEHAAWIRTRLRASMSNRRSRKP